MTGGPVSREPRRGLSAVDRPALEAWLEEVGQPSFRARQLLHAVWSGAANWKAMIEETRAEPDKVFVKPIDFKDLVKWINGVCGRAT